MLMVDEKVWDGAIRDMPKLESPFVRMMIGGHYVVTPEVTAGCEWVFEGGEDEVLATEKLDGTDVSVVIEGGEIKSVWNRSARVPFFGSGKRFIIEGLIESSQIPTLKRCGLVSDDSRRKI
jgi:hypothetical protein